VERPRVSTETGMPGSVAGTDLEPSANGHKHGQIKDWSGDTAPAIEIPTSDPIAALEFCRSLAQAMALAAGAAPGQAAPGAGSELPAHMTQPDLSVVIPVYNEAENLPSLYTRLAAVLETNTPDYEIVFVDDGSRDTSLAQLHALAAANDRVVVELARNFGHQVAISAGLDQSRGGAVIVMDADLQDPPEVLSRTGSAA
jgi:hypothetical protein